MGRTKDLIQLGQLTGKSSHDLNVTRDRPGAAVAERTGNSVEEKHNFLIFPTWHKRLGVRKYFRTRKEQKVFAGGAGECDCGRGP